jgi:hypothetical protein
MTKQYTALLGLVACSVALGSAHAQDKQTGTLKFRALKSFDFIMPKDVWTDVKGSVDIKHPNGANFRAVREGLKLTVDTSGNGSPNGEVKGTKGFLKFHSKSDGMSFQYAARFTGGGSGYKFATSCAQIGTVGGVPVMLFDLNNNGIYNDYGTDAMIVGKGRAASYLSKVISYKDVLYTFEVNEDGSEASVTPHNGEVGTISLAGSFQGRAKLEAVIVADAEGNTYNVANCSSGMKVPVGNYSIVSGFVSKGAQHARIRAGKMAPLAVTAEKTAKVTWGGPLMAEFNHTVAEGKVAVAPNDLKYYGKAGEEYYDWYPNAKSPKFTVRNAENGKEVGGFIFAGC